MVLDMGIENWIGLLAAVGAIAAVVVAVWQARIAVAARAAAELSAQAAAASELRAVSAAERSAEAQSRAADALERGNIEKERAKRKAFTKRLMTWAIAIRDEAEGANKGGHRAIMTQTKKLYGESREFSDPDAIALYEFVSHTSRHLKNEEIQHIHELGVTFLMQLGDMSAEWVRNGLGQSRK